MATKTLHIVLFDVPYPANYGGIIDVFYKLKNLHQLGVKIICHSFYYEGHNQPTDELNNYCDTVYYYERKKQFHKLLFSKLPYIISSRSTSKLLTNLKLDNHPILFEGIHSSYFLNHPDLRNKKKIVRTHNIEHDYYEGLAKTEPSLLKRLYLKREAKRLKCFEPNLSFAKYILSISKMDVSHFSHYSKTIHVPPFFDQATKTNHQEKKAISEFCLFQGNLGVTENSNAVNFILDEIAPKCKYLIKIAGKNPSQDLKTKIKNSDNVLLIENPSEAEMVHELQTAQVNLLFTFQQTGVKLKLINALQQGKHIIINSLMTDSDLFNDMCLIHDTPKEINQAIDQLMTIPFTQDLIDNRENGFKQHFDNSKNAHLILELI